MILKVYTGSTCQNWILVWTGATTELMSWQTPNRSSRVKIVPLGAQASRLLLGSIVRVGRVREINVEIRESEFRFLIGIFVGK